MKKLVIAFLITLAAALPASAKTVIDLQDLGTYGAYTDNTLAERIAAQQNFEKLVTDIGMMISYKPLTPAEPHGDKLPGFDIGVEASMSKIDKNAAYWVDAVKPAPSDTLGSSQYFTKIHAQVGFPIIPIDLGLVYGTSQDIDSMKFTGVELKYALLEGSTVMPALAIRGAYSKLSGVDVLDITTYQADLSISKGFAFLTPYAGVGEVWITGKEKDLDVVLLEDAKITETKSFVGVKVSFLPVMNFVLEGEFATVNTYSLRLNVGF
jgi:hypothetical protein